MRYNLIAVIGPTAAGKTFLGASLAHKFNGEIISADSRQVYRGMDIGTGKDLSDYVIDGNKIPYHLIDVIDPREEFNLFVFNKLFYEAFDEINSRSKIPFLVGGTGLYLQSIFKNYSLNSVEFNKERFSELDTLDKQELVEILMKSNPALHNTTDLLVKERIIRAIMIAEKNADNSNGAKININPLVIGVQLERDVIKKRITARLKSRLDNGMVEEVKKMKEEGITSERLELFGLEYKFLSKYLDGELNYNDMYQKLNSSIHAFAKRQMTWFRKMEKEGVEIHWIDGANYAQAEKIINHKYFQ